MSDNAKRRLAIDLDEIERQLRQGGPATGAGSKADPLAELARITGQDDPFGALLDEDVARRRPPQQAHAQDGSARYGGRSAAAPQDPYLDDPRAEYAAHGFAVDDGHGADARGRWEGDHGPYSDEPYAEEPSSEEPYADPPYARHDDAEDWNGEPYDDEPERRGGMARKSLATAVGLILVALVGVGTALWFFGSVEQNTGEPPLITADPEPARVAPADPGGRVIPNQDTALLDRRAEGETRIVDREEQPVDISGAVRPRVVLPAPNGAQPQGEAGTGDAIARALGDGGLTGFEPGLESPLVPSSAIAALGEPRRVRTVTVRPDGSIVAPIGVEPARIVPVAAEPSPPAAPAPLEPIEVAPAQPEVVSELAEVSVSVETASTQPIAQPLPTRAPPRDAQPPQSAAAAAPAPAQSQPLQLSALPTAPAPAASNTGPSGGYAVQLAIRGSEDRAREAFAQLQGQYASIIGDGQPIIRQATVNGSTIYRIRVGPYSFERATQACDQIKAAAGDCFVAQNR